jgi:hypothetical protein
MKAALLSELRRIFLCALSLGFSCAVFWLIFGAKPPGIAMLHRWYPGFATVLVAVLMAMMVVALRGRLERSAWPIIVGALLGYVSASVAYVIYFGLFEFDLLSAAKKTGVLAMIAAVFFIAPLATLSWLFGALSGGFFILVRYLWLRGAAQNDSSMQQSGAEEFPVSALCFFVVFLALGVVGAKALVATIDDVPSELLGTEAVFLLLCLCAAMISTAAYAISSLRLDHFHRWPHGVFGGVIAAVAFCACIGAAHAKFGLGDWPLALALVLPSLAGWGWPYVPTKAPHLSRA